MKKYLFGIDGGATKSRIVISNLDLDVLYQEEGDSSNIYGVGTDKATDNLKKLIISASNHAGINLNEIKAGCIGSAGMGRFREQTLIKQKLKSLNLPIYICGDGEILLIGGLESYSGISLISGTGSFCLGRTNDGKLYRSGGLGYLLGDEGSAFWISYQAIKRSLRSLENRDLKTSMLPALINFFNLESKEDFIKFCNEDMSKKQIASAAVIVSDFALRGDELAIDIMAKAVYELILLVSSIIDSNLEFYNSSLVVSGGVLEKDKFLIPRFQKKLQEKYPYLNFVKKKHEAAFGALMLAKKI